MLQIDNNPSIWSAARSAEIIALAADSLRLSGRLRLQVRGQSMLPSIWPDDIVEIQSCSIDEVRPGEIVLALRDDSFFLHRFITRLQASGFLLRGDSMPRPDPEFPNQALLGRLVTRAGQSQGQALAQTRPFLPLRPWSRATGQLLCHCGTARSLVLKLHACRKMRRAQNSKC